MTAPAEEIVEQEQDCTDQLGHYLCHDCYPFVLVGMVLRARCGVRKVFRGWRHGVTVCVVCTDLRRRPCERCNP